MEGGSFLSKLILLLILEFSATATATNIASSSSLCPHSTSSVVHWLAYPPEIQRSVRTGNLSGYLIDYIAAVLPTCCPTLKLNYSEMNVTSSEELEMSIRKDRSSYLSLYFPVFANKKETEQYQRPFIGLYNSPGPAVLVPVAEGAGISSSFSVNVVKKSWKLLLLAFVMAAFFGIVIWALEFRKNREQFPYVFYKGASEGVWWAFVTMTTVGYGDIAPKTFLGRMTAVLWMLAGTIILSMFSAQMTADITSNEIGHEINMFAQKVTILLGGKSYLEQEFNLGAEFLELDYPNYIREVSNPTLPFTIVYDHLDTKAFLATHKDPKMKIAKVIDHRFSIGFAVTGNTTGFADFTKCFQRGITDLIVAAMYRRRRLAVLFNKKKANDSNLIPEDTGLKMEDNVVIYLASLVAGMIVLGFLWELLYRRRRTSHGVKDGE